MTPDDLEAIRERVEARADHPSTFTRSAAPKAPISTKEIESMAEHRPDVKAETPIETQHVTATCRENRGRYRGWEDAVHRLLHVYEQQVFRRPGATVSLALYVTDPPAHINEEQT